MKYYEQKGASKEVKQHSNKGFINKYIFEHQFKENFKAMLIWTIAVAVLMALVIALFPMVEEMYAALPAEMLAAFEEMYGDLGNIASYYMVEGGQSYILVGAIYAAIMGINLIKKELKDGSAEFIYSQPVSKGTIFRSKLMVSIANLALFNLIVTAVSLVAIAIVDGGINFDMWNFILISGVAFTIHLQVGLLMFSIAAIGKKNASMGLGLGFVIFTYFLSMIAGITTEVAFLKYFSPFTLVLGKTVGIENFTLIENGLNAIDLPTLITWGTISLVAIIYSHYYFKRNDIL
jgi:ABC-2 type transport system permease protein